MGHVRLRGVHNIETLHSKCLRFQNEDINGMLTALIHERRYRAIIQVVEAVAD
jgi:hypothetical protein